MPTDPVCGMFVPETSDLVLERDGTKYYFCSRTCLNTFASPEAEGKKLRNRLIVGWSLSVPIILLTFLYSSPFKNYILLGLALPVQFYSGFGFYSGAYHSIKSRSSNMDLLVTLGTLIAFFFSLFITFRPGAIPDSPTFFDASSFIITMILTGTFIENSTKTRAGNAAARLLEMIPEVSHIVMEDGSIEDRQTGSVQSGALVMVKAGEIVAFDGTVTAGKSEVDESIITGEQMPVLKEKGSTVISGTSNLNGSLTVSVTGSGKNSTVQTIHDLLEKATFGRTKVQRLADVFSTVFVPVVLSIATATALFWFFYLGGAGSETAYEVAILSFVSVVVVACPCAIGLAGPITFLVSSMTSSSRGIIIRNPSSFDRLVKVNRVIFDKTGTLTDPDPVVDEVTANGDHTEGEVILMAASLERYSNHPIARAIVSVSRERDILLSEAIEVSEVPGKGISGSVVGKMVEITRSSSGEKSTISVKIEGEDAGTISLSYRIREQASEVVAELKKNGIKSSIVTGDSEAEARRVASMLGIDDIHYETTPEEKSKIVQEYQMNGDFVLFVGDGINDSIAMEMADVGVAMGSGTDIAKETGDIVLLNNDLGNIFRSKLIGEKTLAKVKQNLGWAVGYNSILIPVGAGALVPALGTGIFAVMPMFSSVAMGLSSTSVVISSLFLRRRLQRL